MIFQCFLWFSTLSYDFPMIFHSFHRLHWSWAESIPQPAGLATATCRSSRCHSTGLARQRRDAVTPWSIGCENDDKESNNSCKNSKNDKQKTIIKTISGWWFGPPLWKIWKSIGMMTFPIYGKIENVPNHQPDTILGDKQKKNKKTIWGDKQKKQKRRRTAP